MELAIPAVFLIGLGVITLGGMIFWIWALVDCVSNEPAEKYDQEDPGDLVIADQDGMVVVPQEAEKEAISLAWKKVHTENEIRDAIKAGMKATEAYEKFGVL